MRIYNNCSDYFPIIYPYIVAGTVRIVVSTRYIVFLPHVSPWETFSELALVPG